MVKLSKPPHNIAIVRFSALGDVVLAIPTVRSLQRSFPNATLTWITSPQAFSLLQGLEGVQFVVMEKPKTLADFRAFYRKFKDRRFDVVLALQANLRINLLYPALKAPLKIGFDRTRSREGQWLFTNRRIPFAGAHLADSFLAFAAELGADISTPDFTLPVSASEKACATEQLAKLPRPLLAIHPFASKEERNWLFERYAAVIQYAATRWQAGIVLTGGTAPAESEFCARLAQVVPEHTLNLCGTLSTKQLAAVLGEADALLAPDTGPVHIARAMNTPVVGLYAVAPPSLSGPYRAQQYTVNRYPEAVRQFLKQDPAQLKWNTRVHHPQAMALIQTADAVAQIDKIFNEALRKPSVRGEPVEP